jgi:hypothetical protein
VKVLFFSDQRLVFLKWFLLVLFSLDAGRVRHDYIVADQSGTVVVITRGMLPRFTQCVTICPIHAGVELLTAQKQAHEAEGTEYREQGVIFGTLVSHFMYVVQCNHTVHARWAACASGSGGGSQRRDLRGHSSD